MFAWYHRLNGPEFEQTAGDSEGPCPAPCAAVLGSQRIKYELATEQPDPLCLNRMADFCREHTVPGANDL